MKIVVIGTGGVGGYFGARLALSGNDVNFVARGKHLEAIQEHGLQIKSPKGGFAIRHAKAGKELSVVKDTDLVIIATKAWQVKEIAAAIAPHISGETMVLPLQNGVMACEELRQFIPGKHIVGGLCRIFSKIESPGIIHHMGSDPVIIFGEPDHRNSERSAWLKYTFDMAGFTNVLSDKIEVDLWKKFLMICSSALIAVCKTSYDVLCSLPETKKMLRALTEEIYQIGLAEGIKLPEDIVQKTVNAIANFPPGSTSSLTRDVWEGKPSEIDYQNGTVVKIAKKHGIDVPVNEFVYNCILPMEMKARGEIH